MKIIITSVFCLLTGLISAQSNQFIYEYTFKPDSLNRERVITENMVLETRAEGSRFVSQKKILSDSILSANVQKMKQGGGNHIDMTSVQQPKVRDEVRKKYPNYDVVYKTMVGTTTLLLSLSQPQNWKIFSEKSQVLGYKVQKATAKFLGREWIAWFTAEIPIQDGPHEFHGLPGLIVKVEDSKKDHSFVLVGSKKVAQTEENPKQKLVYRQEIPLNEEKFKKYWQEYKRDPIRDLRQNAGSSGGMTITFNGKTYNEDEIMKESEKERKEQLKTNNNFINLELYKP